uniref:ATP synthase complex subunit 8 n=1 Tax=Heteropsylla cubana TaxID=121849 RepID=A0A344A2D4_9HEMI|nr:ATP synthase F0 subunit 8 [Heteropsylla sp. DMP-2018]AWU48925.1 ATP synthase F0 subunit 8 [Heteropsylla sp. DMP-2018]
MPQMAPMPWILLLMMSLITLMLFITIIFFTFETKKKNVKINNNSKFLIKW